MAPPRVYCPLLKSSISKLHSNPILPSSQVRETSVIKLQKSVFTTGHFKSVFLRNIILHRTEYWTINYWKTNPCQIKNFIGTQLKFDRQIFCWTFGIFASRLLCYKQNLFHNNQAIFNVIKSWIFIIFSTKNGFHTGWDLLLVYDGLANLILV